MFIIVVAQEILASRILLHTSWFLSRICTSGPIEVDGPALEFPVTLPCSAVSSGLELLGFPFTSSEVMIMTSSLLASLSDILKSFVKVQVKILKGK